MPWSCKLPQTPIIATCVTIVTRLFGNSMVFHHHHVCGWGGGGGGGGSA